MSDETSIDFICDANVLIHYYLADRRIFKLVQTKFGCIYVPRPVLDDEVDQLGITEAEELGLSIIDPDDELIIRIGSQSGQLSRYDRLIMEMAGDDGLTVWTSDAVLKRQCTARGIPSCWGLEMMILLHKEGHLTETSAIDIAGKIQKLDRGYITENIVRQFELRLKEVKNGKS